MTDPPFTSPVTSHIATNDKNDSRVNPLLPLFTDQGYSDILVHIFTQLNLSSRVALFKTPKHVRSVFTSSSKLQLHHHRSLYCTLTSRPSPAAKSSATAISSAKQLEQLFERETRLDELAPSSIRCIHSARSQVFEAQEGLLLLAESFNKQPLVPEKPSEGSIKDGWSIWDVEGNIANPKARGAMKTQGIWRWRTVFGDEPGGLAMCVSDNVLAVTRDIEDSPLFRTSLDRTRERIRRIYLYTLISDSDNLPSSNQGIFQGGIPHPDAALPYIEIILPAKSIMASFQLKLAPGGKVAVLAQLRGHELRGHEAVSFLGVWDWKRGVSLGVVAPTCHTTIIESFALFGPFIMCSILRRGLSTDPENVQRHATTNGTAGSSTSANGHPSHNRGPTSGKTGRKKSQESKTGSRTEFKRGKIDTTKREAFGNSSVGAYAEGLRYSLEVFQLRDPEECHVPSVRHATSPRKSYTWHWLDLPFDNGIAGFELPLFDSPPGREQMGTSLLTALINSTSVGTFDPRSCEIFSFDVDEALLHGERAGVCSVTIYGHAGHFTAHEHLQCQVQISLNRILEEVADVLIGRLLAIKDMTAEIAHKHMLKVGLGGTWIEMKIKHAFEPAIGTGSEEGDDWDADGEDDQAIAEMHNGFWDRKEKHLLKYMEHNRRLINKSKGKTNAIPSGNEEQEPTVDKPWGEHYHAHEVLWKHWSSAVTMTFEDLSSGVSVNGSRGVMITREKADKDGKRKVQLIVRRYNARAGDLEVGPSNLNMNTNEKGKGKDMEGFKESEIIPCGLVKPHEPPKLMDEIAQSSISSFGPLSKPNRIFYDQKLKFGLGYQESKVELELPLDPRKMFENLAFDGKRIYIATRGGIHIFTF